MTQRKWTIMVYLAGNNNLVEEMVFALREMYRIGSRDDFDVIVQFDTGGPPRRFVVERGTKRTERQREDQDLESLGTQVRDRRDLRPTRQVLEDFICYCLEQSDAEYYMLVLSGHG